MKVKLDDERIIDVRWIRHKKERRKKPVIDTECVIKAIVDESMKGEDKYLPVPLGSGCTYQSPEDQYVRAIGRKISLTRAVKSFGIKEDRRKIWKTYFENCKC